MTTTYRTTRRPPSFQLVGRSVLITGGARGLGRACVEAMLDAGARVLLTTRTEAALDQVLREVSGAGDCGGVVADLSSPDGVDDLVAEVARQQATLDVLVNNAGATWGAPFDAYPPEAWGKVFQLNVAAPFQLVQGLLPLLRAAASQDCPARVVNMGSVEGGAAGPFDNFAYGPSKAALRQLTAVLARRLAPDHVTVNCVEPGPVRTDMTAALLDSSEDTILAATPLGRLPDPCHVAASVVYLASDAAAPVSGCTLPVDGGLAINAWGRESR